MLKLSEKLSVPEIKQIAGRAGRYRTAAQANESGRASSSEEDMSAEQNVGLVTSLEDDDLPYIREAMGQEPAPLTAAGIFPPDSVFIKFAAYFPGTVPFEYILLRLLNMAQVHPLFFMCDPKNQVASARLIDTVSGLRIEDRLIIMAAPLYLRDEGLWDTVAAFVWCVANHSNGRLVDIAELNLEALEMPVSGNREYLYTLEGLHKSIILYLWLSFRFAGAFTDRTLASHVKELVEKRMMLALTEFSANKNLRRRSLLRRQAILSRYQETVEEPHEPFDETTRQPSSVAADARAADDDGLSDIMPDQGVSEREAEAVRSGVG